MTTRYLSIVATIFFFTSHRFHSLSLAFCSLSVSVLVSFDTSIDRNHPSKSKSISRIIVIWDMSVFSTRFTLSLHLTMNNCTKWLKLNVAEQQQKKWQLLYYYYSVQVNHILSGIERRIVASTSLSLTDLLCRNKDTHHVNHRVSEWVKRVSCVWVCVKGDSKRSVFSIIRFFLRSANPFWHQHHRKKKRKIASSVLP